MVAIKSNNPTPVAMRSFIMALAPLRLESWNDFRQFKSGAKDEAFKTTRGAHERSLVEPRSIGSTSSGSRQRAFQIPRAADWLWAYAVCNAGTKSYSFAGQIDFAQIVPLLVHPLD